jgi:two-component sensor histidine kinase
MTDTALTLLYVDDDPGLAALVKRGLERQGFAVQTASDGPSGVACVRDGRFDVVALDHYMPGQDGLQTLEQIAALPDPPPVIFVTGAQDSQIAVAALKAGASDYVLKDVQGEFVAFLKVAAESALADARMRRAKEAAEEEVRASRDRFEALAQERAVLLREVNHRVGNSLQLIASLLQLQASAAANPEVKAAMAAATSRVMAVGQVHKRLYTSDDVKSVSVDQYLSGLVEDLRRSSQELAMLTLEADPIEMDPDRVVAIGVIVNELIINALKYAYSSGKGPIRVRLKANGAGAVLSVEDDGVGRGAAPPAKTSTGLGQRIVQAMAVKLGAEISEDGSHAGMRVLIRFDLPADRAPQPASGGR